MTVPIAFTSDHVETLFEIDIEYAEVLCHKPARTVLNHSENLSLTQHSLQELSTDTALTLSLPKLRVVPEHTRT